MWGNFFFLFRVDAATHTHPDTDTQTELAQAYQSTRRTCTRCQRISKKGVVRLQCVKCGRFPWQRLTRLFFLFLSLFWLLSFVLPAASSQAFRLLWVTSASSFMTFPIHVRCRITCDAKPFFFLFSSIRFLAFLLTSLPRFFSRRCRLPGNPFFAFFIFLFCFDALSTCILDEYAVCITRYVTTRGIAGAATGLRPFLCRR